MENSIISAAILEAAYGALLGSGLPTTWTAAELDAVVTRGVAIRSRCELAVERLAAGQDLVVACQGFSTRDIAVCAELAWSAELYELADELGELVGLLGACRLA